MAVAYDLKVFFTAVGKPAEEVRSADVLGFIAGQRVGGERGRRLRTVNSAEEPVGC